MTRLQIIVRLIVAPFALSVMLAALALGLVGGGTFDTRDRAYFGFATLVAIAIGVVGIWLLGRSSRRQEKDGPLSTSQH